MPDSIADTLDKNIEFGSLTLIRLERGKGFQASLHVGGNSFRVHIADTPSAALHKVLQISDTTIPPCPVPAP